VRALGYKRIVLHGQSLGNIQVQFYAAINWDKDIRGVVLTGMFANLPWKSRHLLIGDEEKYRSLAAQSVELLHANSADALLRTAMPMGKDLPEVPVTAQHFLTYRLEGVSAAEGVFWIKRIPRPVLMIRDEGDMTVHDFEPNVLLAAAQSDDSIV